MEYNFFNRADRAEPQMKDTPCKRAAAMTCDWEDDMKRISPTTAKIVKDTFSHPLESKKGKSVKRNHPIPDTLLTKVPKLDPHHGYMQQSLPNKP